MRPKSSFAVALGTVTLILLAASAAGWAAVSAASDARVAFQASGPAGLKIEGSTPEMNVSEEGGTLSIDVPLGRLATGISLRDQHMRDKYLEVGKYPSATLLLARSALKVPPPGGSVEADVPATLKLHGQSHPLTVHYDARGEAAGFGAHGKFRVNMNEFGITVPTYLGVTVKPEVDVSATFHVAGT